MCVASEKTILKKLIWLLIHSINITTTPRGKFITVNHHKILMKHTSNIFKEHFFIFLSTHHVVARRWGGVGYLRRETRASHLSSGRHSSRVTRPNTKTAPPHLANSCCAAKLMFAVLSHVKVNYSLSSCSARATALFLLDPCSDIVEHQRHDHYSHNEYSEDLTVHVHSWHGSAHGVGRGSHAPVILRDEKKKKVKFNMVFDHRRYNGALRN